jgi:hypothetical protein
VVQKHRWAAIAAADAESTAAMPMLTSALEDHGPVLSESSCASIRAWADARIAIDHTARGQAGRFDLPIQRMQLTTQVPVPVDEGNLLLGATRFSRENAAASHQDRPPSMRPRLSRASGQRKRLL